MEALPWVKETLDCLEQMAGCMVVAHASEYKSNHRGEADLPGEAPEVCHYCQAVENARGILLDSGRGVSRLFPCVPEDNRPQEISIDEWVEICHVREVREAWGLHLETAAEFADMVYGVKFDFHSGGPGYCGPLFIIIGDGMEAPMMLTREGGKGRLCVAN
jgi:hypothetical protein